MAVREVYMHGETIRATVTFMEDGITFERKAEYYPCRPIPEEVWDALMEEWCEQWECDLDDRIEKEISTIEYYKGTPFSKEYKYTCGRDADGKPQRL